MKVFVWRHNRKFHSWSMIDEPNVHQDFYTDAIAVVVAATVDEALEVLARALPPKLHRDSSSLGIVINA